MDRFQVRGAYTSLNTRSQLCRTRLSTGCSHFWGHFAKPLRLRCNDCRADIMQAVHQLQPKEDPSCALVLAPTHIAARLPA